MSNKIDGIFIAVNILDNVMNFGQVSWQTRSIAIPRSVTMVTLSACRDSFYSLCLVLRSTGSGQRCTTSEQITAPLPTG